MAAGLVGHLSSTPFPAKQHIPEGMILSVPGTCLPQGCLPLASWFLSICRCHGRPSALQEALVQEALVLLWYFHCCFFVEQLMPRLLSAAHSLVRWCDPRDCCLCLLAAFTRAAFLSARLLSALGGTREGGIYLSSDVPLLLDVHLGVQQHLEEHTPPPKQQGPSNACCLAHAASSCSLCQGCCVSVTGGEPGSCLLYDSAWLTSQSVLLLSFLS